MRTTNLCEEKQIKSRKTEESKRKNRENGNEKNQNTAVAKRKILIKTKNDRSKEE